MSYSLKSNIEKTIQQVLPDEVFDTFGGFLFEKSFDKKYLLAEEDNICKYMYFITEGSCYSYIVNNKGDKHAVQFALEGYWISDLYSFFFPASRRSSTSRHWNLPLRLCSVWIISTNYAMHTRCLIISFASSSKMLM